MKKIYITPTIVLTESYVEHSFCGASVDDPSGTKASWGGGEAEHSNKEFDNEGYNSDGSGETGVSGNDGTIDAQAKHSMIWDEW